MLCVKVKESRYFFLKPTRIKSDIESKHLLIFICLKFKSNARSHVIIVNPGFQKARDGNITTLVAKKGGVKAGFTELQTTMHYGQNW